MIFRIFTFTLLTLLIIRVTPVASPVDTYYHLAVGRQVYQEQKIPTEDNFIYSNKSKKIVSTEWLSGLIFYTFYKYLGYNGLYILRISIGLLTIFFVYKSFKLLIPQALINNILTTIVITTLSVRFNDRPEMFTFLFISIINYVFLQYFINRKISKLLYILPLIFIVWPSIHAFISFGGFLVIFYLIIIILERKFYSKPAKQHNRILIFFLISILFAFSQFEKVSYFGQTEKYQLLLTEWVSLKNALSQAGINLFFEITILVYSLAIFINLIIMIILIKKILKEPKIILYLLINLFIIITLCLPIKFIRLIPVTILITSPLIILILIKIKEEKYLKILKFLLIVIYILCVIFIALTTINNNPWHSKLKTPTKIAQLINHRQATKIGSIWREDFPEKASNFINTNLATKKLFASNYWNSYFIWVSPQVKVFSDVIFENQTLQSMDEENSIATGTKNWVELINKYNIDTVINNGSDAHPGGMNHTPVYLLPDWQLVYIDNISSVYAKRNVIKNKPLELSAIHPEFTTDVKFSKEESSKAIKQLELLLNFDYYNDFARTQLILYRRDNDLEKAQAIAEESRTLLPKNPWFSLLLASIEARKNNCSETQKYGNEAIKKALNDYHIKDLVNKITENCAANTQKNH